MKQLWLAGIMFILLVAPSYAPRCPAWHGTRMVAEVPSPAHVWAEDPQPKDTHCLILSNKPECQNQK